MGHNSTEQAHTLPTRLPSKQPAKNLPQPTHPKLPDGDRTAPRTPTYRPPLLPHARLSSALDDQAVSSPSLMEMHFQETDTSYAVEAELPGFGEQDVQLELHQGLLKVMASQKLDKTSEDGSTVLKRRRSSTRTLKIPDDVSARDIAASMDKGVLTITLPKRPETAPQKIAVTGAAAPPAPVSEQQQAPAPVSEQQQAPAKPVAEGGDH